MVHVDEWVDKFDMGKQTVGEKYARWFFMLFRFAAVFKSDWKQWMDQYQLYCTYEGKRYRVTGASRMGDIWLSKDFSRTTGYEDRVDLDLCSEWSNFPLAKEYVEQDVLEQKPVSLKDADVGKTLEFLQKIRAEPTATVTVSADELAKLLYKAKDTSLALDTIVGKTEWVQELYKQGRPVLPGLPQNQLGSYHVDIMNEWIKNLLNLVGAKL